MGYYNNVRTDLIRPLQGRDNLSVLEIGAGSGATLKYLKESGVASLTVGIELFENEELKNSGVDNHYFGNVEKDNFNLNQKFDVLLCGDVLEHLVDPWRMLKRYRGYLNEDSNLIFSVPNIRFFKALIKIFFRGTFSYEDEGIFDRTHLRFFCRRDAVTLAEVSGFKVVETYSDLDVKPMLNGKNLPKNSKVDLLNRLTLGLFKEFLSYQTIVVAKKR